MFLIFVLSCALFYPLFSMKEEDNHSYREREKYNLVFFKNSPNESLEEPTLEEWAESVKRHRNEKKVEQHLVNLKDTFSALIHSLENKKYELAYIMFKQVSVVRMQVYNSKNRLLEADLQDIYNYHLEPKDTPFADQFIQEEEIILKERNIKSRSSLNYQEKEDILQLTWNKCHGSLIEESMLRLNQVLLAGAALNSMTPTEWEENITITSDRTKKRCIIY